MRPSILVILCLAVLAPACAAGAESAEPIRLTLAWNLALDAQGQVERLSAIPDQRADRVPQVRARLEQEIRGWAFVSGTVDGRSATTDTVLSATVTLQPAAADSFRIVFDDVRTGGRIAKAVPPKYPLASVKQHETGMGCVSTTMRTARSGPRLSIPIRRPRRSGWSTPRSRR